MRSSTFTTYINTATDAAELAAFDKLEQKGLRTYASLSRAAEKASAATAGLIGGRGAAGLGTQANANLRSREAALNGMGTASDRAARSTERLGSSARRSEAEVARAASTNTKFTRTLDITTRSLTVAQGALGPLAGRISAFRAAAEQLTGLQFGIVGAGAAVFTFGQLATTYADLSSKLRPFYESQGQANVALADAAGIARRSRAALEPVVGLYSRLTAAGKQFGIGQAEASRLTELATKAATISGGSRESRKAGLEQFAQAIGSGNFAGDELKSVKENTFQLADAIAKGFRNADGSIGTTIDKLRELGAEGKLTTREIADALERSADRIETAYARLPATLSTAIQTLGTALLTTTGQLDRATGLTSSLAAGVEAIANNLRVVVGLGVPFAAIFAAKRIGDFAQAVGNTASRLKDSASAAVETAARVKELDGLWVAERRDAAARSRAVVDAYRQERDQIRQKILLLERERAAAIEASQAARAQATSGPAAKQRLYAPIAAAADGRALQATSQLADETERLKRNTAEMAGAQARAASDTTRLEGALANTSKRMGIFRSGLSSLVGFLGGPWGIAFTIATTALYTWATASSAAERATAGLTVEQRLLAEAARDSAKALDLSTAAAARATRGKQQANLTDAETAYKDSRNAFGSRLLDQAGRVTGADRQAILGLVRRVGRGDNLDTVYSEFDKIRQKTPGLKGNSLIDRIGTSFGGSNAPVEDALGEVRASASVLRSTRDNVARAEKAIADLDKTGGAPKPTSVSTTKLRLKATVDALDGGTNSLKEATARRNLALKELDEKYGVKGGKVDASKAEEYQKEAQAIEARYATEQASIKAASAARTKANQQARAEAAQAKRDAAAAERERQQTLRENAETKRDSALTVLEETRGSGSTQEYLNARIAILRTFDAEVNAIDEKKKKSNEAGAQELRDARAVGVARAQITREIERQAQVNDLLLQGRDNEAEALRRTLDLVDRIGDAGRDDYARILKQVQTEERVNDLLESRHRVVLALTGVVDDTRNAFENFLVDLPERGSAAGADFLKSTLTSIRRAAARQMTEQIFAGADAKVRALINGTSGVEQQSAFLASKMEDAGNASATLATAFTDAAKTVETARASLAGTTGTIAAANDNLATSIASSVASSLQSVASDGDLITVTGTPYREGDDIARRMLAGNVSLGPAQGIPLGTGENPLFVKMPNSAWQIYGQVAGDIIANKTGSKLGKVFGDVFEGYGNFSTIGGIVGGETGAKVGGAIGSVAGLFKSLDGAKGALGGLGKLGGVIGKAAPVLGVVASAVDVLDAIGGGFLSDLFSSTPVGSAVVRNTSSSPVISARDGGDAPSGKAGKAVQDALAKIADSLGAEVGDFLVSIGVRGDYFRVSGSGDPNLGDHNTGRINGLLYDGTDAEEAVRIAILNALQDGAIKGIHAGAQRLLVAGQDLETAVTKAFKFENVFNELEQRTAPVQYAVKQLNKEFASLISIFKEAGAADQDYADLAKLYELKRADAIEQATSQAAAAIDQFLKDMVGSSASPLNKRDTYNNAAGDLTAFRADIAAGKLVDQNELLSAARNFQDASRALNGSSQSFFTDFEDLRSLLQKARDNAGITDVSTLPGSPLAQDSVVQAAIDRLNNTQYGVIRDQTTAIVDGLDAILAAIQAGGLTGGGGGGGGSIGGLPGFQVALPY